MTFRSKRDLWLGLVIWIPMLIGTLAIFFTSSWLLQLIMLISLIFIGWIWTGTKYIFNDDVLVVRCGPMKESIIIQEITSITSTKTVLASAALSMDRLEVKYGKWGYTIISPEHQDKFIQALQKINPNITVSLT